MSILNFVELLITVGLIAGSFHWGLKLGSESIRLPDEVAKYNKAFIHKPIPASVSTPAMREAKLESKEIPEIVKTERFL